MKQLFIVLVFLTTAAVAQAHNGITYILGDGIGYIFQGEDWQFSGTGSYASHVDHSYDLLNLRATARRDIHSIGQAHLTLGLSYVQSFFGTSLSKSDFDAVYLPLGVRYGLNENLQAEMWVNVYGYQSYSTENDANTFQPARANSQFFASGNISLSYLF